jgi:hypothetical protein
MRQMLSFSISYPDLITFLYFTNTIEKGVWGERRPKDRVIVLKTLVYTLTHPHNIYTGPCKCIWQIFTLASWKVYM